METVVKPGQAKALTRTVDAANPEDSRYILWDDKLKGFGLRVEPTGRKTFIARYRAGGGRNGVLRQATVGQYGTITPDEARKRARRLLGAASAGADPVAEARTKRRAGLSVADICEWYVREAATGQILGRRGRAIKPSTLETDEARIRLHVLPLIGKRPVHTLSIRDMEEMQAQIAAGKTAARKPPVGKRPLGGIATGGNGVAGRTLAMLRAIFEHAVRRQMIASNPAKVRANLPTKGAPPA
jgi:hypothetical protein